MTSVAIDTSVLLAIFKGEDDGSEWLDLLRKTAETASLQISPVVLAEIRSHFKTDEACTGTMEKLEIRTSTLEDQSALLAGKIFKSYREAGGSRTTILPDFLVAAHAATQADALATSDRGYLRAYFPKVKILSIRSQEGD